MIPTVGINKIRNKNYPNLGKIGDFDDNLGKLLIDSARRRRISALLRLRNWVCFGFVFLPRQREKNFIIL